MLTKFRGTGQTGEDKNRLRRFRTLSFAEKTDFLTNVVTQGKCDLHTHTLYSDGVYTPAKLLRLAKKQNISTISITDHDSVDAIPEALDSGSALGVCVVPGIEMSAGFEGKEIDVLAYFVNIEKRRFLSFLTHQNSKRRHAVQTSIAKLRRQGIELEARHFFAKDLEESATSIFRHVIHLVNPSDIAKALVNAGVVETVLGAFDRYLYPGRPAYFTRHVASLEKVLRIMQDAGALPVLAHPGRIKLRWGKEEYFPKGGYEQFNQWKFADRILSNGGIRGVEIWYQGHTDTDIELSLKLARKHGISLLTGGSDFHGGNGPLGMRRQG